VGFKQWKERHGERIKGARDEVVGKGGAVQSWEKDAHKLNSVSWLPLHDETCCGTADG
jgi:hypothetical protein